MFSLSLSNFFAGKIQNDLFLGMLWYTGILYFFLIYFLMGGKLLYNVVLVSAIQQCETAIVKIYPVPVEHLSPNTPVSPPLGHHGALAELLCYTAASTSYLFHTL